MPTEDGKFTVNVLDVQLIVSLGVLKVSVALTFLRLVIFPTISPFPFTEKVVVPAYIC